MRRTRSSVIAHALFALVTLAGMCGTATTRLTAESVPPWLESYREPAARLIGEAVGSTFAWERLASLTDSIGNRLSGTPALDRAIAWAVGEMKRDGLENVHTERVMVPKWVRGSESAEILEPARHQIVMLGLGNSVGTPPEGVQAEVLIARSFEDLEARGELARGRIVLFNVPFANYGETVRFRSLGPSRAARLGAVAMFVRAVGPAGLRTPHTGELQYTAGVPNIPAAAITTEDADRLQRMADRGSRIIVRLRMEAHFERDVESANVVGELRGRELPDEVVVVGGHIDSWDVGAGASDDGGGCVVTWEALRIMKKLNLRPRRTVRVVLWTNEENGGRGGQAYRDKHRAELAKHVMMLESDSGVFRPLGFGFTGNDTARDTVRAIATLLTGIAADQITPGGGGADIGPSVQEGHVPSMSLDVDGSKYFLIHHTPADTVDKIDPTEMAKCAAAVAVMTYVIADLPQRLGE
ncbi:MAG TPA: M20/M25/M40 family metallo-hydrolase [Vicinamibacterales bacterium]|nr:M20/M25/M40 family metallo-hydrolase [Vicinamibacterales bacterium]